MSENDGENISLYNEDERQMASHFMRDAYDSLLAHARNRRRRANFRDTMMTEDVLQECFLKMTGQKAWNSPEHFLRSAALAVRQVVVDHARSRLTAKRGNGQHALSLDDVEDLMPAFGESPEQLVIINDLLARMEAENPRWVRVVDTRFFSGMSEAETAAVLGLSERTVRRDWQAARAWLEANMTT
ncbi:MAG: ECF-type sigma factor [Pseudomonadota bacterium]